MSDKNIFDNPLSSQNTNNLNRTGVFLKADKSETVYNTKEKKMWGISLSFFARCKNYWTSFYSFSLCSVLFHAVCWIGSFYLFLFLAQLAFWLEIKEDENGFFPQRSRKRKTTDRLSFNNLDNTYLEQLFRLLFVSIKSSNTAGSNFCLFITVEIDNTYLSGIIYIKFSLKCLGFFLFIYFVLILKCLCPFMCLLTFHWIFSHNKTRLVFVVCFECRSIIRPTKCFWENITMLFTLPLTI